MGGTIVGRLCVLLAALVTACGSPTNGTDAGSPGLDVAAVQPDSAQALDADAATPTADTPVVTDSGTPMQDVVVVADAGGPNCASGQTVCGGACVTTATDPANCGACGMACALAHATAGCAGGVCTVASCATGYADCNHSAADGCEVNTATDGSNCGACGRVCAAGTTCSGGACDSICASSQTYCGGSCVNTATDPANCGACGMTCALHGVSVNGCAGGACTVVACAVGYVDCNTVASDGCEVNTGTDVHNCGACGHACSLPGVATDGCVSGACTVVACAAGYADCDGVAGDGCEVNTGSNAAHCGSCGTACPGPTAGVGSSTCTAGACGFVCTGATSSQCGTGCYATATDVNNCGACGHVCAAGTTCSGGACTTICASGQTYCGGSCVSTATDINNCGACGHACATGTVCSAGVCVTATAGVGPSCPSPSERGCGTVAIPGGSFTMGGDASAFNDTPAAGTMTISAFTLDAYEVTVSRFRRFWAAGHPAAPGTVAYPGGTVTTGGGVTEPDPADGYCTWSEIAGSLEAHPINCVDWYTAQAFCVWDGGRLPTEAEWEYAARGTSVGGLTPERSFPWGNTPPSSACDLAEWDGCTGDDGAGTKRVGSFAPSGGLYDLAGNVWEWNADWYEGYTDATCWNGVSRTNPVCNNNATGLRVVRGGSWYGGVVAPLRSASRLGNAPSYRLGIVGVRCARTP